MEPASGKMQNKINPASNGQAPKQKKKLVIFDKDKVKQAASNGNHSPLSEEAKKAYISPKSNSKKPLDLTKHASAEDAKKFQRHGGSSTKEALRLKKFQESKNSQHDTEYQLLEQDASADFTNGSLTTELDKIRKIKTHQGVARVVVPKYRKDVYARSPGTTKTSTDGASVPRAKKSTKKLYEIDTKAEQSGYVLQNRRISANEASAGVRVSDKVRNAMLSKKVASFNLNSELVEHLVAVVNEKSIEAGQEPEIANRNRYIFGITEEQATEFAGILEQRGFPTHPEAILKAAELQANTLQADIDSKEGRIPNANEILAIAEREQRMFSRVEAIYNSQNLEAINLALILAKDPNAALKFEILRADNQSISFKLGMFRALDEAYLERVASRYKETDPMYLDIKGAVDNRSQSIIQLFRENTDLETQVRKILAQNRAAYEAHIGPRLNSLRAEDLTEIEDVCFVPVKPKVESSNNGADTRIVPQIELDISYNANYNPEEFIVAARGNAELGIPPQREFDRVIIDGSNSDLDLSILSQPAPGFPNGLLEGISITNSVIKNVDFGAKANLNGSNFSGSTFVGNRLVEVDKVQETGKYSHETVLPGGTLNLKEASFRDATLVETKFRFVNLDGADFSTLNAEESTIMHHVIFDHVSAKGAKLIRVPQAINMQIENGSDFDDSKWLGSSLPNMRIKDSSFIGAKFTSDDHFVASMREANIENADFWRADFSEARLNQAKVTNSKFEQANFNKAKLIRVKFDASEFDGATFVKSDLKEAKFVDSTGHSLNFTEATLPRVELTGTAFEGSKFDGASFKDSCIEGSSLAGSSIYKTNFFGAIIVASSFDKTFYDYGSSLVETLKDSEALVKFDKADLEKVSFVGARLPSASFIDACIFESLFEGALLDKSKFHGAQINASFKPTYSYDEHGKRVGSNGDRTSLTGADFSFHPGRSVCRTNVFDSAFNNVDLSGSNWSGAYLSGCEFPNADMRGILFNKLTIKQREELFRGLKNILSEADDPEFGQNNEGAGTVIAHLESGKFILPTVIKGCHFNNLGETELDYRNTDFNLQEIKPSDMRGAKLEACIIGYSNFAGANLKELAKDKASFFASRLENSNFVRARLWRAELTNIIATFNNFVNATFGKTDLSCSNLLANLFDIEQGSVVKTANGILYNPGFLTTDKDVWTDDKIVGQNIKVYDFDESGQFGTETLKEHIDNIQGYPKSKIKDS